MNNTPHPRWADDHPAVIGWQARQIASAAQSPASPFAGADVLTDGNGEPGAPTSRPRLATIDVATVAFAGLWLTLVLAVIVAVAR